jgi:hypothetical protein
MDKSKQHEIGYYEITDLIISCPTFNRKLSDMEGTIINLLEITGNVE